MNNNTMYKFSKYIRWKLLSHPEISRRLEYLAYTIFPFAFKDYPRFESWSRSKGSLLPILNNKQLVPEFFSKNKKCIIVVDYTVPQSDRDAGSRTLTQWLNLFIDHGMNVKFWPENLLYDPIYTRNLQRINVSVFYGSRYRSFKKWMKTYGGNVEYFLLSRPQIAINYIDIIRKYSPAKILYYGQDIHYLRLKDKLKANPDDNSVKKEIERFKLLEESIWTDVDVIYYPSDSEKKHVESFLEKINSSVIVKSIPVHAYSDFQKNTGKNLISREGIIFVGGFAHPPNEDGVVWLLEKVMPLVWKILPNEKLYLIGSNPTEKIKKLSGKNVIVTGFVSDQELEGYYKTARVSVAPLQYGGGVKGKVVESMKFGLPIVTTSVGAQGLSTVKDSLCITDESKLYADYILNLIHDDITWKKYSERQLKLVSSNFSIKKTKEIFAEDIDALV
jgi:O-antigen biosynthesis protein